MQALNSYSWWNDKIAQHFFNTEMDGRAVYLYVTEELINSLGMSEGLSCQDFIQAVKNTFLQNQKGICYKALSTMKDWRLKREDNPSYLGYLAFFVLAAGTEGDFSNNAYYPRLRELLGEEPTSRPYPEFDQMQGLWKDLEKWANVDNSGERGNFNLNVTGRLIHVGIPISQTLLTEEELKTLPIIFASSGLEAIYHPSDRYIALLLAKHGRNYLRKRTLCLLEEANTDKELRRALIERVIDELRIWDGTTEMPFEGETYSEKTKIFGILRLCCKIDSIAKRANFTLRCTIKQEFPEDGLVLNFDNYNLSCNEHRNGWSSPIKSELCDKNIDASELDWLKDLSVNSPDKKWHFKLPASSIHIFVEGKSIGLPGLVEVGQVPSCSPFYLVAHQETHVLLEEWGKLNCKGFEKLNIVKGLPRGWQLFKIANAHSDEIVKNKYPILSFPTSTRLELEGGIRIDKGNWFFKFAPPKLVLQGGDELVKLYCNGNILTSSTNSNTYELPLNILANTKIEIEARNGNDDIIKRLSLYLVENFPLEILNISNKLPQVDSFGNVQVNLDNNLSGVIGAWVRKSDFPEFNFNTLLPIQGKQRIIFVGKEPGQIVSYPQEALPIDWHPVWAIAKGILFDRAKFCGTSLKESEPKLSRARDRNKLDLWKKILLGNSKRTLPPMEDIRFKKLWEKYQKEAKHVKG
jgi:hypothetical protein